MAEARSYPRARVEDDLLGGFSSSRGTPSRDDQLRQIVEIDVGLRMRVIDEIILMVASAG